MKYITYCIFAFYLCVTFNSFADDATPIQLRVMQTRKFSKPIDEVQDGIITNCEDFGGTAQISPNITMKNDELNEDNELENKIKNKATIKPIKKKEISMAIGAKGLCFMPQKNKQLPNISLLSFIPIVGSFASAAGTVQQMVDLNQMMKSVSKIQYELKSSSNGKETVVRMRMYSLDQAQITSPEIYAENFKKVADSLFIQAIELTPAEQQ